MYWGPWRTNIYCGMKTRTENPVFMGVGWSDCFDVTKNSHTCEQTEDPYVNQIGKINTFSIVKLKKSLYLIKKYRDG